MSMPARAAAAAGTLLLFVVTVAAAAASAVTSAATEPLTALRHAVAGDPGRTQQRWSAEDYVRLIAEAEEQAPTRAAAEAIAFAASRVGLPYVWGGIGPSGYDCSGLTQAAYKVAGVDIPRVATAQYRGGDKVGLDRLAPGDLVYYGTSDFAHHVAIYLGRSRGESVVLDAPHTGAVVRLDPLFAEDLFGATRPAGASTGALSGAPTDASAGAAAR